jgi:hypothetical protein
MSKFITVALLVGVLFAGATQVMAQGQGGVGDPLSLAASGVVVPFFTSASTVATLQVTSPTSDNPNLHMRFFDASCAAVGPSVGIPLTTNDIAFQQVGSAQGGPITTGTNGLITLANVDATGFQSTPLLPGHQIHARVYLFSTVDGRSRVIEPIILNTAEFPSLAHWWSPLRSGGAFFAPLQTATVQTNLFLVCPKDSIQGNGSAFFGSDPGGGGDAQFTNPSSLSLGGFPQINPRFPPINAGVLGSAIRVKIYDTNEVFKRDFNIDCNCVIEFNPITSMPVAGSFYADTTEAAFGTYTELTSTPTGTFGAGRRVTFTGYTNTFTVGSAINAFFARFHNGSQNWMDGITVDSR